MLDRAAEHDGLTGQHPQVAQDVPQPAKMRLDGIPGQDPAPARLGGQRRDAEIGRGRRGGARDGPAVARLPHHVPEAVAQRELAGLPLDGRRVVQDERLKCFRQVTGVQVDQVIRTPDQPLGHRGGDPLGGAAARVTGKAAVEVLPVERDHEGRARPEQPAG